MKNTLRVYPLSQASNLPAVKSVDISGKVFNTISPSDYSLLNSSIASFSMSPLMRWTRTRWASSPPSGSRRASPSHAPIKNILEEVTAAGDATVRSLTYRTRIKEAYFYPNSA